MIAPPAATDLGHEERKRLSMIAARLRRHSLTSTAKAGSGHPTSSMSTAELMSCLFFKTMRYDVAHPSNPSNDRFVLSKGHAAPVLWAALAEAGAFPTSELDTLRKVDSPLEGHPTPRSPWIDVATGSLGQGLSAGAGMAWYNRLRGIDSRVWVLLGDGELAEGSVWEAAALASYNQLSKLCAIVDVNCLGQTGETMLRHDVDTYVQRFTSFGWNALSIDGHDLDQVAAAYAQALHASDQPTAIIARTIKGKGVSFLEGTADRHGKPITGQELERALAEIGDPEKPSGLSPALPEALAPPPFDPPSEQLPPPNYHQPTATRDAYGSALRELVRRDQRVVVLDAEVGDSTRSRQVTEVAEPRFLECFIAEQNMIGMAQGCAALGAIPYCSTFASFLTRAFDQLRMAAVSDLHLVVVGSHAGVSIGQDGPSQMGLEDIAMMRTLPNSTVLCPADAVSTERLTALATDQPGVVYLRLSRPPTAVLYGPDDQFSIGGSQELRRSSKDAACIIATGICVDLALRAADVLIDQGVGLRVIDAYSIKPIDREAVLEAVEDTGRILVVEDHYAQGGLGDVVAHTIAGRHCAFRHLAVRELPRSGARSELLERYGIGQHAITNALEELLAGN